jgi:hypothetical protein
MPKIVMRNINKHPPAPVDISNLKQQAMKLYHLAFIAAKANTGQNYFGMSADEKAVVDMLEKMGFLSAVRPSPGITGKPTFPKLFEDHTVLLPR